MDMDRNSSHDTHLNAHPNPSSEFDPGTVVPSTPDSNPNINPNPSTIPSTIPSTSTNSPTKNAATNTTHLIAPTYHSHPTPNLKGAQRAMFRSSIEPVDASGEWLPAVAILGQSSSAGSVESVGAGGGLKRNNDEGETDGGNTTRTSRGRQLELNVATQAHTQPQASTSASSSTAPTSATKPRPPMMPSMARIRPSSLDLSEAYPPDVDDEGDGPSSSDPLNSSFSVVSRNPRYSMTSNARYSLISSPPETPIGSSGFSGAVGPLPPRFMNMNTGGGDGNFGPSAFGGSSGSGVDVQPPPPSWTTGSTGYPVHPSVQLQDNGANTGNGAGAAITITPWHSYHVPRDTVLVRNDRDSATSVGAPTSVPRPIQPATTSAASAETSGASQWQTQPPQQPWTYPANQQSGYPQFSKGPDAGASYYNPWSSHAPSTRPGDPWSAPASHSYNPWCPPMMSSAEAQPHPIRPQPSSSGTPIQGVRFASEYLNSKQSESEPLPPGYEANDPFKRHTKPVQPTDDLTFDDIPVPGKPGLSQSWQKYEGSAVLPQQQRPSSSAPVPSSSMGQSTSRPSQYQPGQNSNPTPWSQPTYSHSQPPMMGSAPPQQQPPQQQSQPPIVEPPRPGPPLSGSGSGSGPYLPLNSNHGSYQSYPYYPPPISPAHGTWKKPLPLWRRILGPFKRTRKDNGDIQYDVLLPPFNGTGPMITTSSSSSWSSTMTFIRFVFLTVPSQIYLYLLLRLPSLYFSRVARIFEEADLTLSELKKMALEIGSEGVGASGRKTDGDFAIQMQMLDGFNAQRMGTEGVTKVPVVYERLNTTWEAFIDSVLREWKTFNIISVLLLSAILTILQIEEAAADPVTRYTALYSLVCALISLLFGCVYIIRFGTMRKAYKAAEWALEAKKSKTLIWWNVWILLAMPAIWLSWSLILYVTCILSFVWRTGDPISGPPSPLSSQGLLTVRIVLTVVLGLGALYGSLIFTTFRRYGEAMDKKWKARIDGWIREKANQLPYQPFSQSHPYSRPNPSPYYYPSFVSPPYDPRIHSSTTGGIDSSWYPPSQMPSNPPLASNTPSGYDSWGPRAQQLQQQQQRDQGRRFSPSSSNRNLNEGTRDSPPTREPLPDDHKSRQDPMDHEEEVPRYSDPNYRYGYIADTKAQYEYEPVRNMDYNTLGSGQKEKTETSTTLPRTEGSAANSLHPQLDQMNNRASTSALTVTQAPPYTSPSTSPTPPSYSSIPAYATTHNINTNPFRFNPPLKKNPQVSMPPPPSLPTIPGTPLTIVTMRSFDSTAGAENYPLRGSPGNDSMSASTSISNLQIEHSPGTSTVIGGLSPRAASKRPSGADELDPSASGPSSRSRSMSPQPLLPSGLSSAHIRSLSDISIGVDRSSQGSRLGFERLPPGAAPPSRTSGEAYDAS